MFEDGDNGVCSVLDVKYGEGRVVGRGVSGFSSKWVWDAYYTKWKCRGGHWKCESGVHYVNM